MQYSQETSSSQKKKKKQEEKVCARVLFFTHALESQKTTNQQTNK